MNFKIILNDFLSQIKDWSRDKGTLFWSFAFPIIMMVLFGLIFSNMGSTNYSLYVQDLDNTDSSHDFLDAINNTTVIDVKFISLDIENVDDYMSENDISSALIIEEGFKENMGSWYNPSLNNTTANLTLILDESQQTSNSVIISVLNSIIQEMNLGVSGGNHVIIMEQESIISEEFNYIDFFLPGVVGMTIMMNGIYGSIFRQTKFRTKGILRKLSTTPIKRSEWLLSRMMFMVFLAFLSTSVIILVGILVFGISIHINIFMILTVIAASFAFSGMGMIVTRFVKEEESADTAGGAITMPMMFLAGTFIPLEQMPDYLQVIAKFLPLYYVNEGLRDSMIFTDMNGAFVNTAIIGVLAIVFFVIGMFVTSWKED